MRVVRIKALSLAFVTSFVIASEETASGAVRVAVAGGQLVVKADGPEMNVVDVRRTGLRYNVFNGTSDVTPGDGCAGTTVQPVTCEALVLSINVEGGEASDLIGLEDVDVPVVANGGAGDDAIDGGAGQNSLKGGVGVDKLVGGRTGDELDGGEDDDLLLGGTGTDKSLGGPGDDILQGGAGEGDVLRGEEGQDLIRGGSGSDLLDGGKGDDVLVGGSARDQIAPGSGANRILGKFDIVACGPEDQGNSAGCKPLEGSASTPSVWPPKPSVSASTRQASASLRAATAWPRIKGRAREITVRIRAKRKMMVRICIRTFNSAGHKLDKYRKWARTKFTDDVGVPNHSRPAWTASARRQRHCPRKKF